MRHYFRAKWSNCIFSIYINDWILPTFHTLLQELIEKGSIQVPSTDTSTATEHRTRVCNVFFSSPLFFSLTFFILWLLALSPSFNFLFTYVWCRMDAKLQYFRAAHKNLAICSRNMLKQMLMPSTWIINDFLKFPRNLHYRYVRDEVDHRHLCLGPNGRPSGVCGQADRRGFWSLCLAGKFE